MFQRHTKRRRPRRRVSSAIAGVLVVVIVLLIAGRVYLPYWLTDYVNHTLNKIDGYEGYVEDIDVALIRGAYQIHGLNLKKVEGDIPVPFLTIHTIDLSLQWGALLRGEVVSDIDLVQPQINFAVGRSGSMQTGAETNWLEPIEELMPIDINSVTIQDGVVSYKNFATSPEVSIAISQIEARMHNIRNVDDADTPLPSSIDATGVTEGNGTFKLQGHLNLLREWPDSDLDMHVEQIHLPALNDYSNAFAALDFVKGTLNVYAKVITKDGAISGYIKPLATGIEVVSIKQDDNPFEWVWESVASILIEVLNNQKHDQFATKIPLQGSLKAVEMPVLPTISNILYNAFIEAFRKGTGTD